MIPAEQINQTLSMRDIAERYGMVPHRAGFISCPCHSGDNTPSMKIYGESGKGFYCFSCNVGGDVIKFVQLLFGVSFKQAVVRIASDFGMSGYSSETDSRRWRREQRAKAHEKQMKQKQELDRFTKNASVANKLRLEMADNMEIITEWDPARIGYFSPLWVDAMHERDSIQNEWEEVMNIE